MSKHVRWRWENEPVKGDPGNLRNKLVIGDELLPIPYVILECGNVDEVYKERIRAVPELMGALEALVERLPIPDPSMRREVHEARALLERLWKLERRKRDHPY